jgi:hypothetical protein
LLALTRRHASQTIGLGIANGLFSGFGTLIASSQDLVAPVERIDVS